MAGREALWREMEASDLDGVVQIARLAFPDHFEDRRCFAERLALYPRGCFVLDEYRHPLAGYLIAYPWRYGSAPPLNSLIHRVPDPADVLYLHDLALHPDARGQGYTALVIERLVDEARRDGWQAIALVAVNRAADFWTRAGFAVVREDAVREKLATYGEHAAYMVRKL